MVTYTVVTGTAQIFVNGDLIKQDVKDPGVPLSTDWEKYAGKKTQPIFIVFKHVLNLIFKVIKTMAHFAINECIYRILIKTSHVYEIRRSILNE